MAYSTSRIFSITITINMLLNFNMKWCLNTNVCLIKTHRLHKVRYQSQTSVLINDNKLFFVYSPRPVNINLNHSWPPAVLIGLYARKHFVIFWKIMLNYHMHVIIFLPARFFSCCFVQKNSNHIIVQDALGCITIWVQNVLISIRFCATVHTK